MRVLLTDGHYKHTLAAVRSLGARRIDVDVVSPIRTSLSFYSRFCQSKILCPWPTQEEEFVACLLETIRNARYDVLVPIGGQTCICLSKYQDEFVSYTKLVLPPHEKMAIASNKIQTFRLARELGIPVPDTLLPESQEHLRAIASKTEYPVVIKGPYGAGSTAVDYADSSSDLLRKYAKLSDGFRLEKTKWPMVQEYIRGPGHGFFALFNHGQPRAIFMHKRIREYPPTGGPSVVAESVNNPQLKGLGLRLLESLDWHGVAMVEFKLDSKDGTFKLMEINPKFWGSLELAIASGVEFPYLLVRMATDGDVDPTFAYTEGARFRWLFPGEILHVLSKPSSLPSFLFDFFRKNTRYDIYLRDINPTLLQLGITFWEVLALVRALFAKARRPRE